MDLTSAVLDRNAAFLGVPTKVLMENAGQAATRVLQQKNFLAKIKKIQIFCGPGGNGGDGFVVARELIKRGFTVEVFLITPKIKSQAAAEFLRELPKEKVQIVTAKTKITGDLVIEAIFGVGQRAKLPKSIQTIVQKIQSSKVPLVSLDCPLQGLQPELTIAFETTKNAQKEIVVPIGIPQAAKDFFGPGDVFAHFPRRSRASHKRENGVVIIVGGSRDFLGAPIFAAYGAQALGVDLVYLFVPKCNFAATRKFSPNFLVREFSGNETSLTPAALPAIFQLAKEQKATFVLGPGLGRAAETVAAICQFAQIQQPLVLDADAILPYQKFGQFQNFATVLTPHAGELQRLAGRLKPQKLAQKLQAVILQKGQGDRIFGLNGEMRKVAPGSPILTVGGTGDFLAGLVGGLLARKVEPFCAAGLASFCLAQASLELALKLESLTPQILARQLPRTISKFLISESLRKPGKPSTYKGLTSGGHQITIPL